MKVGYVVTVTTLISEVQIFLFIILTKLRSVKVGKLSAPPLSVTRSSVVCGVTQSSIVLWVSVCIDVVG